MKHDASFVREADALLSPILGEPDLRVRGPALRRMIASSLGNALMMGFSVLIMPLPHRWLAAVLAGTAVFVFSLYVMAWFHKRRAVRARRDAETALELRRAARFARLAASGREQQAEAPMAIAIPAE